MYEASPPNGFDPNVPAASPPIFACVIPSRLVQTNATHLPPNRFVFNFDDLESINHLVVFLTGIVPLPDGYAASIHFQFPNKPDWQLLGMLSPTKPSAIFRLRGLSTQPSMSNWMNEPGYTQPSNMTATLGIIVGPIDQITAECSQLSRLQPGSSANPATSSMTITRISKSIGLNLFNYISSFSATSTFNNQTWVPISVLENWWRQFETKLVNSSNPEQWLLESNPTV